MDDQIAVIGLACRVPGAPDVHRFWRNLIAGESARRELSRDHLLRPGVPAGVLDDPDFVPVGYLLEEVDGFDAGLFGLTPREADLADPQHRLFLELCHAALENAGWDPAKFAGDVGVYGGRGMETYRWRHVLANRAVAASADNTTVGNGNHADTVTTLVSYHLNLRGPSIGVYTACSTSLVAVHLAVEALRAGECDMALAGGVNIELPGDRGYLYREGGTESVDGYCRPFDAQASGTVAGSGGGVVLLKRLSDAIADGDQVRALVIGNAVNNDGGAKVGFTAAGVAGQAAVIANALAAAGVDPRSVGYVEASAIGSTMGDPLEVEALASVYGRGVAERQWCALGSVKSNVGHLSQGAGVVGLIKTVLSLEHGLIPPIVGFSRPNPAIDFAGSPFYVNTALSTWEQGPQPRRAAVSSFGIGGTNAHVLLEEAPARPARPKSVEPQLLTVSARSVAALDAAIARLADHLAAADDLELADVAHTLRSGRVDYPHRTAVVATDVGDAVVALRQPKRHLVGGGQTPPRVVFLLPDAPFAQVLGIAQRLQAAGVRPASMIGYGGGAYVEAALTGTFSVADAARLAALHDNLLQAVACEPMLTISGPVPAELPEGVSVVAVHGPNAHVVCGPPDDLDRFTEEMAGQRIAVRKLRTTHASRAMITVRMVDDLAAAVAAAGASATDARRWAERLRQPIQFGRSVAEALAAGPTLFVECGPGRLAGLAQMQTPRTGPQPVRVDDDPASFLAAAGRLWANGVPVVLAGTGRRIALPGYPYERTRHWIEPDPPAALAQAALAWRAQPAAAAKRPAEPVALFAGGPTGRALATRLRAAGTPVITVEPGDEYARVSADRFVVRPNEPVDYQKLTSELSGRWIHAWCLPGTPADGMFSLLHAVQSAGSGRVIDVVTTAALKVLDHDNVLPELAMLAGVISSTRELPGLRLRHVDVSAEVDLELLVAELSAEPVAGTVALRAGQRWTLAEPLVDDPASPDAPQDVAGRLAPIWSTLLGVASVGPLDDFFDLGGSSLTAVQLIAQIRAAFAVRLTMRAIFDSSTLEDMAQTITQLQAKS